MLGLRLSSEFFDNGSQGRNKFGPTFGFNNGLVRNSNRTIPQRWDCG